MTGCGPRKLFPYVYLGLSVATCVLGGSGLWHWVLSVLPDCVVRSQNQCHLPMAISLAPGEALWYGGRASEQAHAGTDSPVPGTTSLPRAFP